MTLLIPWLVFPLVMAVLSLACGLLLERVAGTELPAPLLVPAGFVVVSLAAQFSRSLCGKSLDWVEALRG